MRKVIGIDPGPTHSALVILYEDGSVEAENDMLNEHVESRMAYEAAVMAYINSKIATSFFAIEDMTPYGSALMHPIIETLKWCGRFYAAANSLAPVYYVSRVSVKTHLLGMARGTDSMVSDALLHMWGGKDAAKGTKMAPGPLRCVKGHGWAALAVAVTARDTITLTKTGEKKP